MPHPLVIVAGVAIVLGAGYLVVNELSRRSDEEEWYQNYCAMVRAEGQQRTARRRKEDEEQSEEGGDEKEDAEVDARRKDARTAGLRRRPAPHAGPDAVRGAPQAVPKPLQPTDCSGPLQDFPLIDLSQHSYPPSTPSWRASPPPQPHPAPLDSDLIFAAPPTSPEPPTRPLATLPPSPPSPKPVEHPTTNEPLDPFLDQPISPALAENPFSDRSGGSSDAELVSEPQASPREPLQNQEPARPQSAEGLVPDSDLLSDLDWTDLGSQSSGSGDSDDH